MISNTTLVFCAALLWFTVGASTAHAETLTFYGDRDLPPFESLELGTPEGASVDLAHAIGRILDRPVEVRLRDWSEAQSKVLAGDADALTLMVSTPEREHDFAFSQPTFIFTFALFVRAGSGASVDPMNLQGKRIGVTPAGFPRGYIEATHPAAQLVFVDDSVDGTRRLLRGEIDALAVNTWTQRYVLKELNISGVAELAPFAERTGHVAVRRGNASLLAEIDRALTTLKESGEFDRIIDRWGSARVHLFSDAVFKAFAGGALVALIALVALTAMSLRLRKQRELLAREVAERRHAEKELRAANKRVEKANQSKSEFLAATSHDLRQPLQSISLLAAGAALQQTTDRGREMLTLIKRSVANMAAQIDTLLDVARLDSGTLQPEWRDFPLCELTSQLDDTFGSLAAAAGLTWRVEACEATVRSDPKLLLQILANLAQNALRYTQSGSVEIRCEAQSDRVRIHVIDTGIGIPPELHERIWDEFFQAANPERNRTQGVGLGLSIVKRFCSLLDHPVHLDSQPGRGTRFTVEVPLSQAHGSDGQVAGLEPCRILVIDDDELVTRGLTETLEGHGHSVVTAASGDEAERLTEQHAPDVVVSDFRLPGGTGVDVVRRLRERLGNDLPAVILTGEPLAGIRPAANALGIAVLQKPVRTERLMAALRAAIVRA